MSKFCTQCGSPVKAKDKFCADCGTPVGKSSGRSSKARAAKSKTEPSAPVGLLQSLEGQQRAWIAGGAAGLALLALLAAAFWPDDEARQASAPSTANGSAAQEQAAAKPSRRDDYDGNDIAYFGAEISDVSKEVANKIGLDTPRGAYMVKLEKGGPAKMGGVRDGDVILMVDALEIADMAGFLEALTRIEPGSEVKLTLRRGRADKSLALNLGGFLGDNLSAAKAGDVGAMGRLVNLYISGRLGESDLASAESWARRAGEAGDKAMLYRLGSRFWSGNGVKEDRQKALQIFRESADQGHANGMITMARINYEGLMGPKNMAEAKRYYEMAAAQGNAEGMRWVGNMLEEGEGGPKDLSAAHGWYLRSAEAGDRVAMYNVGVNFHTGKGAAKNYAKAVRWYQKSLDQKYQRGLFNLSLLYYDGQGVARDRTMAAELAYRALKLGDKHTVDQLTQNSSGWDQTFRKRIQELMWRDGAYEGTLDGSFGPQTKRAILAVAERSKTGEQPAAKAAEASPAGDLDLGGLDDLGTLD